MDSIVGNLKKLNFLQIILDSKGSFDDHIGNHVSEEARPANDVEAAPPPPSKEKEEKEEHFEKDGAEAEFSPDIQYESEDDSFSKGPEGQVRKAFVEINSPIVALVFLREYQKMNGDFFPYVHGSDLENRPTRIALPLETGEILPEDFQRLSEILLHLTSSHNIPLSLFLERVIPGALFLRTIEDFSIRFEVDFAKLQLVSECVLLKQHAFCYAHY